MVSRSANATYSTQIYSRREADNIAPTVPTEEYVIGDEQASNTPEPSNTPDTESTFQLHPWSIAFTMLGVVLLDFNCDACQSPCRAYLLDVTTPEDHPPGLTTFTLMAGLGGSMGYIMGGINWQSTKFGETLGSHVRVVFTSVLVIYIVCLGLTITSIKEAPLSALGVGKADLQKSKKRVKGMKYKKFANESDTDSDEEFSQVKSAPDVNTNYGTLSETHGTDINLNGYPTQALDSNDTFQTTHCNGYPCKDNQDTLPGDKPMENGMHDSLGQEESAMPLQAEVSLKDYLFSIVHMPRSLVILCVTNLFCWMSLVCYSLYFTDFVGQAVYGGNPQAPVGSREHDLYEEGVRMGSFGMSLYSFSCAMYSLVIEKLVKKYTAKPVYICSQLVYTLGASLMAVVRHPAAVVLLSPCAGIMYATLFTMPYLLLAHYHSNNTFDESSPDKKKSGVTIRGLGTDIATVSSMVFVAQFILSACMGSIVHATGSTVAVIVSAAILSFCGSLVATKVMYLGL